MSLCCVKGRIKERFACAWEMLFQAAWLLERKGMEENAGVEGRTRGDGCVLGTRGLERKSFCYFDRMLRYTKGINLSWEWPSAQSCAALPSRCHAQWCLEDLQQDLPHTEMYFFQSLHKYKEHNTASGWKQTQIRPLITSMRQCSLQNINNHVRVIPMKQKQAVCHVYWRKRSLTPWDFNL